jgi:glutathione S-transferase
VNPYKKEKHFLAINPRGLVPALEYQGKALYESLILCEFLEDAYPSHSPHLLPVDAYNRARVRIWIDYISKNVLPANIKLIQAQEKEKQDVHRGEIYSALRTYMKEVKGPWFLGDEFSLADVAIAPWVVRDFVMVEHRGFTREAVGRGWAEYAARLESRESVIKTNSDKEYYEEIYDRYLHNESQSEVAKAARTQG